MQTVLLHALPLDATMWVDVAAELDGPVIAPTLYGLGDSIEEWATEVLAMTQPGPLAVVGNSVGGSCALEVARLAPERVKLIVLVGAKAGHRPEPALRDEALALLERDGMQAAWERYWCPLIGSNTAPAVIERLHAIALAQDPVEIARGVRAFHARADRSRFLRDWEGPVLIADGEHDPISKGPTVAAPLRGTTFVRIPDAGHYVPLEKPTEFASLLCAAISNL